MHYLCNYEEAINSFRCLSALLEIFRAKIQHAENIKNFKMYI